MVATSATPPAPVDHPEKITRLIAAGDERELQAAVSEWFAADPVATRDWLASQESFEPLQPALARIACSISESGDPAAALDWAALLQKGPRQDQTLFDIYALAGRSHRFSEEEIRAAPLPPERIELLLGGVADD